MTDGAAMTERYLPEGHIEDLAASRPPADEFPGKSSAAVDTMSSDEASSLGRSSGGGSSGWRPGAITQPALGLAGWARWTWRQLTSMRVALLLLMLLAVAALPGSVFPQRPQTPERVAQYLLDHPGTGPWLDRLGFFDVYASGWFSAVYLLLFVSLVGCILPRAASHLRALRDDPPAVPRSFARFPARAEAVLEASPADAQRAALLALRHRYRARPGERPGPPGEAPPVLTVRAERGYLRETGNLVFHLALVGVLVAVALGQVFGFRGQVILVEGRGFANAVVAYDSFQAGPWFRDAALEPFSMTLDSFASEFDPVTLAARDFAAEVTVTEVDGSTRPDIIRVNHPLAAGGARVYLSGNGYAPAVTVRDGTGAVAFSGPVPFLPQDGAYTSRGVVKVPDVSPGQPQLGFVGFLLPTAVVEDDGARSIFPQPLAPVLVLTAFAGDLGLDDGIPQNVYELDTSEMDPVAVDRGSDGGAESPLTLFLEPGQSADLPDGLGTVTFDGLPRFVALDLRHDPAVGAVLVFSLLATAGLAVSLFVPRRRLWLRLSDHGDGRTVASAAGLARGEDPGLQADVDRVLQALPGAVLESPRDGTVSDPPDPRPTPEAP